MSYILDALRRADSERERERGKVPGLNAQPVPAGSLDVRDGARSKAWIWVVVGVTLGLALPLTWRWIGPGDEPGANDAPPGVRAPLSGPVTQPDPPAPPPAAVAPTDPPTASPTTAPTAPPAAAPAPDAKAAPPAAPRPRPKAPPPTAKVEAGRNATRTPGATASPAAPASRTTPGLSAAAPMRREGTAGAGREAAAPRPPTSRPALATAPAVAPLPRLAELPEDVRREVPTLAFGGSVHSELPAQRMVILNGQLLREGDAITNDLAVEEIRQKSAVLRIKGRRFELVF